MGLSQALYSGVSGMQVHQTALDVLGNNIANVDTVGFKAGDVSFEDQLSETLRASSSPTSTDGGQNATQVGLGVQLGAVSTLQTQGNLEATGKTTDMAIQGNGFFLVGSGSLVSYTRDGSFDLDSNGDLVNPASGLQLLGYPANSEGAIDTSLPVTAASTLAVPIGTLTSVAKTTKASFGGNLDAGSALQLTEVTLQGEVDYSSSPGNINTTVYDSSGTAHTIAAQFSNQVQYSGAAPAGAPTGAVGQMTVTLSVDGVGQTPQTLYIVNQGGVNKFIFADSSGNDLGSDLTTNVPVAGGLSFPITVNFGNLQASTNLALSSDGQAVPSPVQSANLALAGNLNLDGTFPVTENTLVYSTASGSLQTYQMTTTISNPRVPGTGGGIPAGANEEYDLKVTYNSVPPVGSGTTLYDSSTGAGSPVYYVPGSGLVLADGTGNQLGSSIDFTGGTLATTSTDQGLQISPNFPLTLNLSGITTTTASATADGQTGSSPTTNASISVYDSLGVQHNVNVQFTRELVGTDAPATAASKWAWTATDNGVVVGSSGIGSNAPLYFDAAGNLLDADKQSISVTGSGGVALPVSLDFSTITQLAGTASVTSTQQDGFPVGTLSSFEVSDAGLITGSFSNGQSRTLGQIALANFANPDGLLNEGQNLYSASSNSGQAQVGLPNVNGLGEISTGYVEQSNVDLSTEFTNLITTQRGFEANTKIITVVDQMLQDVLGLLQG